MGVEGDTEEAGWRQARADVQALLVGGRIIHLDLEATPEGHPWQPLAGMVADDPDWDAFQASLHQYREAINRASAEASMLIRDTDHISRFQRRDPPVTTRVWATPALELATTVITGAEPWRGRVERVRRARSDAEVGRADPNVLATFFSFRTLTGIDVDEQAQTLFTRQRAQRRCMGTLDLRMAAMALSRDATHVTRNRHDCAGMPSRNMDEWAWPGEEVTSPCVRHEGRLQAPVPAGVSMF
jgi:tRNA(fMet)-specific endonuclease VapC